MVGLFVNICVLFCIIYVSNVKGLISVEWVCLALIKVGVSNRNRCEIDGTEVMVRFFR